MTAPPSTNSDALGRIVIAWAVTISLALATFVGWLSIPLSSNAEPVVIFMIWFNISVILGAMGFEIARRAYSLHVMHLISMFLFLGAASLFQYSRGSFGVPGAISSVRDQIIPSVLATTLWLIGYIVVYEGRRRALRTPVGTYLSRPLTTARVLLLCLLAMVALGYLASAGLIGVTTRAAAERAIEEFSLSSGAGAYTSPIYILTSNLARALPPMALLAALLLQSSERRRRSAAIYLVVIVVAAGTLLINNPFAANRMFFTCSLVAFSAPFILIRFKTSWPLVVGIAFGIAILPALGNARYSTEFKDLLTYMQLVSPVEYLSRSSDVDSLGMTALVQKWIDSFGHTWGRQISGAFLSFIPRAIWPTKPIGTGGMVTRDLGFEFTNLSPPILSEALIDFGLPGTLILGGVFGFILSRIDSIYWVGRVSAEIGNARIIDVLYPFLLVSITFYTRGDLFAATGFGMSFVLWILPLGLGLRTKSRARAIPPEPDTRSPVISLS